MNKMKQIKVEKVTLNMGVGEPGEPLKKAAEVVKQIAFGAKSVQTLGKVRAPTWGVREGLPIGVKTTLRGKKAIDFLIKAFKARENKLKEKSFDSLGNFGFGIEEYIDIPGVKYDPRLGIMGLDVLVTLERPGYRIKRRKNSSRISKKHLITKQEAVEFVKQSYGVEII
ncbi:MAG TPA: 50S ribosomal protein L5 [archaeon]|nr:50S ribosomal protein L5 [archaeon]